MIMQIIQDCFENVSIKNRKKKFGGGSLLDLGIYTIIYCQFVFQQEPVSVIATGTLNKDGVDIEMSGEIQYGDNKIGKIKSSVVKTLSNTAKIIGTKGEITVNYAEKQ